jgi:hypothetical protein
MKSESSLAYSLAIGPCYEPDESIPHRHTLFLRTIILLFSNLLLGLPNELFLSGSLTRMLYAFFNYFMLAACYTHFILLGLIIAITYGEMYIHATVGMFCTKYHRQPIASDKPRGNQFISESVSQ